MRCESFLARYESLDAGEEPGFMLRIHAALCPSCAEKINRMEEALECYRSEPDFPGREAAEAASMGLESRVMASISLLPRPKRELRARDWLISGAVIVLSMAMIPFDVNFSHVKEFFGASFALPLSLVLGSVLTLFGAVFIATHIEELEPMIRRYTRRS